MIKAILFDLDGTLADSEEQTDEAIAEVMAGRGFPGVRLPPLETRGRSWADIVRALARGRSIADPDRVEGELLARWNELLVDVRPVPGAPRALREAASVFRLGVVSSSPRSVIDRFLAALGIGECVSPEGRVGADDVRRHKPDPEGFLLAAARLGALPDECVIFEDSEVGLQAARAARMASVAVLHLSASPDVCRSLADAALLHYDALPAGFWASLAVCGASGLPELLGSPRS